MKRHHKNKRTENGTFRYAAKSVHRTLNVRGVGVGLIEELRRELVGKKEVSK